MFKLTLLRLCCKRHTSVCCYVTSSVVSSAYLKNSELSSKFDVGRDIHKIKRPTLLNHDYLLRGISLVLTDDGKIEQASILNKLDFVKDLRKNVIACSTHDYLLSREIGIPVKTIHDKQQLHDSIEKMYQKEEYKLCVIHNRAYKIEEWSHLIDQIKTDFYSYSMSMRLRFIMFFLLPQLDATRYRSDNNWHNSALVQSFVNYIFSDNATIEKSQPALSIFIQRCVCCGDLQSAANIYGKIRQNTNVVSKGIVAPLLKEECLYSDHHDVYEPFKLYWKYYKNGIISERDCKSLNLASVGIAAFRRNDPEIGIRIILDLLQRRRHLDLNDEIVEEFLHYYRYTNDADEWNSRKTIVFAFFNHLYSNFFALSSKKMAKAVAKWFTQITPEHWSVGLFNNAEIKNNKCPITNKSLALNELTDLEFDYINDILLGAFIRQISEKVNVDFLSQHFAKEGTTDLYKLHAAKELSKFLEFLLEKGPFDLVIDGLNLVHLFTTYSKHFQGKHKFKHSYAKLRHIIMKYRRIPGKQNSRICIMMRSTFKDGMMLDGKFLFQMADIYFVHGGADDDIFVLYGALASGKQCYFASFDLYRNYKHRLQVNYGNEVWKLFEKYQRSRQISLYMQNRYGELESPPTFSNTIQRSDSTWHFPYYDERKSSSNVPSQWLCVTQGNVPSRKRY